MKQAPFILRFLFFAILAFFLNNANAQSNFVTTWKTDNAGTTKYPASGTTTLRVPFLGSGPFSVLVESVAPTPSYTTTITAPGNTSFSFNVPVAGTYRLTVAPGNFNRVAFSLSSVDNVKLLAVEHWGDIEWGASAFSFQGCLNMDVTATDTPDLSQALYMSGTFSECRNLVGNSSFNTWETGNVVSMIGMFQFAEKFNQPLSNWNTGNVIDMTTMFSGATVFNQSIGNWNTAKVIDMTGMFQNAAAFNQPIGNWDISSVTSLQSTFLGARAFNQPLNNWNTANVKTMWNTFWLANSFNQPLNNWNTSKVTTMRNMFANAFAFNQNLGAWNLSALTIADNMLAASGLDCNNYSRTITGWAVAGTTPNNINLASVSFSGGVTRKYGGTAAVAARANLTTTKGWTITGDEYDATCSPTESSLPVSFGSIIANLSNDVLQVNWQTLTENDNAYFKVQVSKDGEKWTDAGTVQSKAANGNSNNVINYSFSKNLSTILLAGFGFAALLLLPSFKNRLVRFTLFTTILVTAVACSKNNDDTLSINKSENIFVRVVQVDIDETTTFSNVIKVTRK